MRRLGASRDSLELLLDTVCSMFGAILLIAILVALMAQTAHEDNSGVRASAEMLQRRIAIARADLAESGRLIGEIAVPTDTTAGALATEKSRLEAALTAAREQSGNIQAHLQDHIARETVDFGAEWKKLIANSRDLARQEAELDNDIKSQDQNAARLIARAEDLNKSIQQEKQAHVINLRFPKERARTKSALPIICKFGKIYPLMDASGNRNETTIVWSKKGSGNLTRPIEALGWTATDNKSAFEHLFGAVSKGEIYIAFYVYPDSFDAFHAVRDLATAAQLDFGVEMERAGSALLWGPDGNSPPPL